MGLAGRREQVGTTAVGCGPGVINVAMTRLIIRMRA